MVDDEMGANFAEWELSYQYVKKLRELNERVNVSDATLEQNIGNTQLGGQHSAKIKPVRFLNVLGIPISRDSGHNNSWLQSRFAGRLKIARRFSGGERAG